MRTLQTFTTLLGISLGLGLAALPAFALPSASSNGNPSNFDRISCQSLTHVGTGTQKQTSGCPRGTIFVSATDPSADFKSIQAAVQSLPNDTSSQVILIGPGTYNEFVNVSRSGPLTLLGQTNSPWDYTSNQVQIVNAAYINQTSQLPSQDDADTATLTVAPNRAAALIGAGPSGAPLQGAFGNTDFKAYNIDLINEGTTTSSGPALTVDVSYARASFYHCSFASYQDTWYAGRNASVYTKGGIIKGYTDYLFGFGTAWFEHVTLANRGCGGGITAWKGTGDFTTLQNNNTYGAYISNSKIIKSPDASASLDLTGSCSLGRPWNNLSRVVYLNTYMDNTVRPDGFTLWSTSDPRINGTFYAEYGSSGPGYNASTRASFDHILTRAEARQFTIEKVFGGRPSWIDFSA